jgi:hypothetical protein
VAFSFSQALRDYFGTRCRIEPQIDFSMPLGDQSSIFCDYAAHLAGAGCVIAPVCLTYGQSHELFVGGRIGHQNHYMTGGHLRICVQLSRALWQANGSP